VVATKKRKEVRDEKGRGEKKKKKDRRSFQLTSSPLRDFT